MSTPPLLIDSFVWLEILAGTERGRNALSIMDDAVELCTSVVNVYEVYYRAAQMRGVDNAGQVVAAIESHARVIPVDGQIARAGALIKLERGFGAIDALCYATARIHSLTVLTGDRHFEGLDDAILI